MIGELTRRDYRAIVSITNYDGQAEQRCLDMVRQNKVDGVIALTYNPDLEVAPDLPFVSIDRHFRTGVPCVASDNFGGGQLAAGRPKTAGTGLSKAALFASGFGYCRRARQTPGRL